MTSDHLDDDALSAALDGEATPVELAHLGGCAVCGGRSSQLRRAAALVGGPVVAPAHERREAAIRAAVAAAPTVLANPRRVVPQWLAAAAALLVLAALGGLLLQTSGGGSDAETAATTSDAEPRPSADGAVGGAGDAPAPTGAADLGAAAPESGAVAAAPAPGEAAFDGGDVGSLDGDLLRAAVERHLRAAPRGSGADDSRTSDAAHPPCEAELRAAGTPLGSLRLVGRGTLGGAGALLLAFDEPEGAAVVAFVVAPAECRVLRSESVPTP